VDQKGGERDRRDLFLLVSEVSSVGWGEIILSRRDGLAPEQIIKEEGRKSHGSRPTCPAKEKK